MQNTAILNSDIPYLLKPWSAFRMLIAAKKTQRDPYSAIAYSGSPNPQFKTGVKRG